MTATGHIKADFASLNPPFVMGKLKFKTQAKYSYSQVTKGRILNKQEGQRG